MRLFGGLRQRISATVFVLLVLLTAAITTASVMLIRRIISDIAREGILRDVRILTNMEASWAAEHRTQAKLLAAGVQIISAIGTPGLDRATLEDVIADIRMRGGIDMVILWDRTPKILAISMRGGDPHRAGFEGIAPRTDGAYVFIDRMLIHAVSAEVISGGERIGFVTVGDILNDTTAGAMSSSLESSDLCFVTEWIGLKQICASHFTTLEPADLPALYSRLNSKEPGPHRMTIPSRNENYLMYVHPLSPQTTVMFVKSLRHVREAMTAATLSSLLIAACFLLVSTVLIGRTSRAISRPIDRLVDFSRRIAAGNFDADPDAGPDEVRALNRALSEMAVKIQQLLLAEEESKGFLEREVQRRTEELSKSESQYRDLYHNAPDCYHSVGPDGRIIDCNQTEARLLGYRREEMIGRPLTDFLDVSEIPKFDATFRELKSLGRQQFEGRMITRDSTPIPVMVSSTAVYNADGNFVSSRTISRDIRALKLLQEAVARSEKLASIGTLAAGVAHELNNPLTGVMGYAQMLVAEAANPQTRDDAENILKEARRCSEIVKNLLRFARQRAPTRALTRINPLIDGALKLARMGDFLKHARILREFDANLPDLTADDAQLQQVFVNLAQNAFHAMADSEREAVLTVQTAFTGYHVRIRFIDTGQGMSSEVASKIFDPFFTTKGVGKGTGLGLSVSLGIIEQHGGKIFVEHTGPEGTTITILLPFSTAPAAATPETSTPERSGALRGRRALVVDDEETGRQVMKRFLSLGGCEVFLAPTVPEALRLIEAEKTFDLIFSDMRMPGMSGIDFFNHLKEQSPGLARRLVYVTGDTLSDEVRQFLNSSGCVSISKPYTLDELLSAAAGLLTD